MIELIQGELDRVNENYARVEQIKRFFILDHDLSQETGELTPTLKVKRNVINDLTRRSSRRSTPDRRGRRDAFFDTHVWPSPTGAVIIAPRQRRRLYVGRGSGARLTTAIATVPAVRRPSTARGAGPYAS